MYGDRDVCNLYPAVRFCCKAESVNELSLIKIKKYREDYRQLVYQLYKLYHLCNL